MVRADGGGRDWGWMILKTSFTIFAVWFFERAPFQSKHHPRDEKTFPPLFPFNSASSRFFDVKKMKLNIKKSP